MPISQRQPLILTKLFKIAIDWIVILQIQHFYIIIHKLPINYELNLETVGSTYSYYHYSTPKMTLTVFNER